MRLVLEGDTRIRLEMAGEGFEIASEPVPLSPYNLLAGSLASCAALMFVSWAEQARIDLAPLTLTVAWEMTEDQGCVKRMAMELRWPRLPESRVGAADGVADACAVPATLAQGTGVTRRVTTS